MAALKMKPDWSELLTELLNLISQRITTEIDLIRFRSVCSNWRSSSIRNHFHISPFNVPLLQYIDSIIINNNNNNYGTIPISFYYLSKHSFYLIKPSQEQEQEQENYPWLIRVTQSSCGNTEISQSSFLSTDSFDYPFDILDFNELSIQLVAGDCFLLPDEDMLRYYNICVFKGRIYKVIDKTGRTITVGPEDDPKAQLAAEPLVDCGPEDNKKFLVESEGELLLVDIDPVPVDLKIRLFRLDEKERKWVKFEKNLRDRVLFIGTKYSFSASASDLCVPKGNCIIFIDEIFSEDRLSIVHLDQDRQLWPLCNHPEYYDLFWPPPKWIIKSQLH
ncbi:hypothetical protein MtrunA17_Chr3g0088661 [Medicago truncatula]|uniref:DUF295 family protein n=1 Tax=Medicago truncatula TaxID=3880 RepID=G7IZI1_MEDTR|nr:F-box protein At2g17036 [Medicago truncatula]AES69425.1 DUF295 family protein [Medicago truncatula]RHN66234.1 hypothetical protein MtrunA17_Chr3g0088661 [Medicago truncatula]